LSDCFSPIAGLRVRHNHTTRRTNVTDTNRPPVNNNSSDVELDKIATRLRAAEPLYLLTAEQRQDYRRARDAGRAWVAERAMPSHLIGLAREVLPESFADDERRLKQSVCEYLHQCWAWNGRWYDLPHCLLEAVSGVRADHEQAIAQLSGMWNLKGEPDHWWPESGTFEQDYPFRIAAFLEGALRLWLSVRHVVKYGEKNLPFPFDVEPEL
jgi:hypothetical protein